MKRKVIGQAERDLVDSVQALENFFAKVGTLMGQALPDLRKAQAESRENAKRTREIIAQGATAPGKPFRL